MDTEYQAVCHQLHSRPGIKLSARRDISISRWEKYSQIDDNRFRGLVVACK
jgi:hypothetical protein